MPDHVTMETLARFMGRLHPMVVHFPIALLLLAALLEARAALRRGGLARSGRSPVVPTALVLGTISAIIAVWFGWWNAAFEGQRDDAVFWHRWLGVATAVLAMIATAAWFVDHRRAHAAESQSAASGRARLIQRLALFATAVVLTIAGHLGGALTYGDRYLIAVFDPPRQPVVNAEDPVDDRGEDGHGAVDAVDADGIVSHPVFALFETHCVECHGPDKQKGRFRLDQEEMIFRGARDLWAVEPGDPEASLLMELITLPADDPDRMPPEGPLLTESEVEVVAGWIRGLAPRSE